MIFEILHNTNYLLLLPQPIREAAKGHPGIAKLGEVTGGDSALSHMDTVTTVLNTSMDHQMLYGLYGGVFMGGGSIQLINNAVYFVTAYGQLIFITALATTVSVLLGRWLLNTFFGDEPAVTNITILPNGNSHMAEIACKALNIPTSYSPDIGWWQAGFRVACNIPEKMPVELGAAVIRHMGIKTLHRVYNSVEFLAKQGYWGDDVYTIMAANFSQYEVWNTPALTDWVAMIDECMQNLGYVVL